MMRRINSKCHTFSLSLVLVFLFLQSLLFGNASGKPKQPGQPTSGPGGAEYSHAAVKKSVYGEGNDQYWIFEPINPPVETAPVIVFNHGWSAMNPKIYGAWIEHLVRRGNIVIYPRYQADLKTPTRDFAPNATRAVKDALRRLQAEGGTKPELEKFAIVGHSAGGQAAANMAALATSMGLPKPKAVMCVEPGKTWSKAKRIAIPLEDMSMVPGGTLLLTVVGDKDNVVRDIDAKKIFNGTSQIPLRDKDFVVLVSDDHGEPALVASHFAPCAPSENYDSGERKEGGGFFRSRIKVRAESRRAESDDDNFPSLEEGSHQVDALDYYGLWKLFDALCDAAFYGKNRDLALGGTAQQRYMGKWSDGVPVKELVVTDNP